MTWFRLGGRARHLFRPRDAADLAKLMRHAAGERVATRVLGAGANVLISDDGVDGIVVRLDQPAFKQVELRDEGDLVIADVGAGVDLMPFARTMSRDGLSGLECMAGIPATVGGAVRMNAGGKFGDISGVVRDITLLSADGELETWPKERIGFGYRRSAIAERTVLSARLALTRDDPERTRSRYEEYFEFKQRSQPMSDNSAGCIFKNPPGQSAGALIDRAGMKGFTHGRACVSERHANFVVTKDGATTSDVLGLIDAVRKRVQSTFGVALEVEVDIW